MPKMDGIKLYEHLRKVDQEVVICFFTAYEHFRRDFEIMHPEEPMGCFIQKPISIDRLVSTIIKKMDERENRWRRRL
jgi:DNA-binding NtrC family response regulator